ncbi:LOW QUALITY PROTEIN: L-rhamnose-binding lectin CSL1-like [Chanos chanos]|uniref:LOW QUALITY PROTEIN: L-rhamnose-binding lectin CSL1-like n=1 Tax=Chanos chanos TaxID=29144 RepID=A0A6J2VXU6_CHACN|nr:LOW QUALITY PROTEIN: L-rhamnose-binding lectin CSL1-like [Chanos chanos]
MSGLVDGVINVQSATYGRKDKELCSIGRPPTELANTNCLQAVPLISQICNGRRECEINPHTFSLPDPCYGTYKYFTTTYECIPAWTSLTCEAGYSKLNCGNYVIQINTANYGRTDSTICSAGRPSGQITNTNCFAPKTFTEVSKQCNGKHSCYVHASHTIFSDPCFGTYKYLEISYFCLPVH